MTRLARRARLSRLILGTALGIGCFQPTLAAAQALPSPFVQSVAAAASKDEVVAAWYATPGMTPSGPGQRMRRGARRCLPRWQPPRTTACRPPAMMRSG